MSSQLHNFISCPTDYAPTKNLNQREEEKHHSLTERDPVSERRSLYIFFLIRSQEDRSEALLRQDQWTELDDGGTLTSQEREKNALNFFVNDASAICGDVVLSTRALPSPPTF